MPRPSKRLVVCLAFGTAAAAADWLFAPPSPSSRPPSIIETAKAEAPTQPAAQPRWTSLPSREAIGKPVGELFSPYAPAVQVSAPSAQGISKPLAPRMPYRIVGKFKQGGASRIVLVDGDRVFTARVGEKLEGGYKVESIRRDRVVLLYVPLGTRETLRLDPTFMIDEGFGRPTPPGKA